MKSFKYNNIVYAAVFCALVFAGTWIYIPLPVGNINLGDCVILICTFTLGGWWSVGACAMGAALTDLMSGYAVYAPGTLVIKALMPLAALGVYRLLSRARVHDLIAKAIAAVAAEVVMILGYFLFEAVFMKMGLAAAAQIPFNAIQGGIAIAVFLPVQRLVKWVSSKIR